MACGRDGFALRAIRRFLGAFPAQSFSAASDLSIKDLGNSLIRHLRFERPGNEEAWSYNVLQRLSYLLVIFVLFPLMIWTGLAMSMGFTSAFPLSVRLLGGQQTARSLHFLVTILLVLFLVDSCADGVRCGISKSDALHDHWPRYPTGGVNL